MGVTVEAYSAILDKQDKAGVETDTKLDLRKLRGVFASAAKNDFKLKENLLSDMVGHDVRLLRSRPHTIFVNIQKSADEIRRLTIKDINEGPLSKDEEKALSHAMEKLAEKSGFTKDFIKQLYSTNKANYSQGEAELTRQFPPTPVREENEALRQEIVKILKREARGAAPDAAEASRLQGLMERFSKAEKYTISALENVRDDFIKSVRDYDEGQEHDDHIAIIDLMNTQGKTLNFRNAKSFIILPDFKKDEQDARMTFDFPPDDLPSRTPPGTVQQWVVASAVHEAEHTTQNLFVTDKNISSLSIQRQEIDGDNAMFRFLDSMNAGDMKDYFLRYRQLKSFFGDQPDHDTATFLRIYEATGQYINLEKFNEEKTALIGKIYHRLPQQYEEGNGRPKVGDLMGAAQDVLREEKLSPLQRDQIEMLFEDATMIGYTINPDYPKREPETQPAPQASFPLPKFPAA